MKQRAGLWLVFASLLVICPAALAGEVSDRDRFELWNKCRPTKLVVGDLSKYGRSIGLTRDAVEIAARSRLRGARLFTDKFAESGISFLHVQVSVSGRAFSVLVSYRKLLEDSATGQNWPAATWVIGKLGTHGGDSNYILGFVENHTDEFIDEYLRVNAGSCG